jgi:hypothetical protein
MHDPSATSRFNRQYCTLFLLASRTLAEGTQTTTEGCLITSAGLAQRDPATLQCAPPAAVFVTPVTIGADCDLSFTVPTNEHPVVFGNPGITDGIRFVFAPTKEHPVVFGNLHFFHAGMVDDSLTLVHTASDKTG